MATGAFFNEIFRAVKEEKLLEPFMPNDVRDACPGYAENTYSVFLPKHRIGNPGRNTELFERMADGSKLIGYKINRKRK
ncbi:MAG: hypothetical protein SGI97_07710 [candidate division Zixibacteria bacterium]|nr:hypothetical protein [candidate division Zixibacteria bacterium]